MTRALSSISAVVDVVFVLTVPSAIQRQEETADLLRRWQVPFEFLYGADLRECSVESLIADRIYDPVKKQETSQSLLTSGEIGCALTHRRAAERLLECGYRSALILEDDVCVVEGNAGTLDRAIEDLPSQWRILYFGYNKNNIVVPLSVQLKLWSWYPIRYWTGSQKHDPDAIRRIFRRPFNRSWYRAGCFNGAHAYAISRSTAESIVAFQMPVCLEADVVLKNLVRFSKGDHAYCLRDEIFDQRWDIPSLIGDRPAWHQ